MSFYLPTRSLRFIELMFYFWRVSEKCRGDSRAFGCVSSSSADSRCRQPSLLRPLFPSTSHVVEYSINTIGPSQQQTGYALPVVWASLRATLNVWANEAAGDGCRKIKRYFLFASSSQRERRIGETARIRESVTVMVEGRRCDED